MGEFDGEKAQAFPQKADEDATGRIENRPKVVSVPSVVSKSGPKSIPISSDTMHGNNASDPGSMKSKEPSIGQQTGKLASTSIPSGNSEKIDSFGSSSSAQMSNSGTQMTEAPTSEAATGQLGAKPSGSVDLSGLDVSTSDAVTGNLATNSSNIKVLSQKSIEVRKEQIQRAKKRAVDQKRKRIIRIVRRIVLIVLFVVTIAAISTFSVHRWGIYDDAADLQGTWQIEGTKTKVKIGDGKIRLNKEVSYSYSIDPNSKTITFDFGQLEGKGRYRFSMDRNKLSLMDGEFETTDTLSNDIPWTIQAFWDFIATSDIKSPELGEGSITLDRVVED